MAFFFAADFFLGAALRFAGVFEAVFFDADFLAAFLGLAFDFFLRLIIPEPTTMILPLSVMPPAVHTTPGFEALYGSFAPTLDGMGNVTVDPACHRKV